MKKLKIMLLSLALIAVVGSALAFKARYLNSWCITATTGTCPASGLACPIKAENVKIHTSGTRYCTVALPGSGSCSGVNCGNFVSTFITNND